MNYVTATCNFSYYDLTISSYMVQFKYSSNWGSKVKFFHNTFNIAKTIIFYFYEVVENIEGTGEMMVIMIFPFSTVILKVLFLQVNLN